VFENPLLSKLDDREDYADDRWIGVGMMSNGIFVVLVFYRKGARSDPHYFHEKGNEK
jgi:uncharacterized DUF497 family protein